MLLLHVLLHKRVEKSSTIVQQLERILDSRETSIAKPNANFDVPKQSTFFLTKKKRRKISISNRKQNVEKEKSKYNDYCFCFCFSSTYFQRSWSISTQLIDNAIKCWHCSVVVRTQRIVGSNFDKVVHESVDNVDSRGNKCQTTLISCQKFVPKQQQFTL